MNIIDQLPSWVWLVLPFVMLVLGLIIKKTGIRLPGAIEALLNDADVIAAVREGIRLAGDLENASDAERREHAVAYVKNQFYSMCHIMLSDSAADLLVQLVYTRGKFEGE